MAQIVENNIVIKISRIVRDAKEGEAAPESWVTQEMLDTLETVTQELVGGGAVIEAIAV